MLSTRLQQVFRRDIEEESKKIEIFGTSDDERKIILDIFKKKYYEFHWVKNLRQKGFIEKSCSKIFNWTK